MMGAKRNTPAGSGAKCGVVKDILPTGGTVFYILTNSRGMTARDTTGVHRKFITYAAQMSKKAVRPCLMMSRNGVPLRSHSLSVPPGPQGKLYSIFPLRFPAATYPQLSIPVPSLTIKKPSGHRLSNSSVNHAMSFLRGKSSFFIAFRTASTVHFGPEATQPGPPG